MQTNHSEFLTGLALVKESGNPELATLAGEAEAGLRADRGLYGTAGAPAGWTPPPEVLSILRQMAIIVLSQALAYLQGVKGAGVGGIVSPDKLAKIVAFLVKFLPLLIG